MNYKGSTLRDLVVRVSGYRSRGPGVERGPLSLVTTTKGLFGRKDSGSGIEIRKYGRKDQLC
jgi:hypothetical protein